MILIDNYPIDLAVKEEHGFENMVTDHPVSRGADVTDHVILKPITVVLEGCVSDTPIADMVAVRAGVTSPSREAFDRLLAIRNAKQPVTIETSLRVYTDMMLESLSVPRDSGTGDALVFTVRFRQIRLVEVTRVAVDIPRVEGKVDRGNKPAATPDDAGIKEPEEKRSLLKRGVNYVRGKSIREIVEGI